MPGIVLMIYNTPNTFSVLVAETPEMLLFFLHVDYIRLADVGKVWRLVHLWFDKDYIKKCLVWL